MATKTEKQGFVIHSKGDKIILDDVNKNWKTMDGYSLIKTSTSSTTLSGGSTVKMNWHITTIKVSSDVKYVLMHGYAAIGSLSIINNVSQKGMIFTTPSNIKIPLPIKLAATYNVQMNYASTNPSASKGPRWVLDYSITPSNNYGELVCKIASTTSVTADNGRLYVYVFGKAVN